MSTEASRLFAAEIAGRFHTNADRAWTVHRSGQLTCSTFKSIPLAEELDDITPIARVRTRAVGVFEYLGIDSEGWLMRGQLFPARYERKHSGRVWDDYVALPYLRVVDDLTGYALPDPFATDDLHRSRSVGTAKLGTVPPIPFSRWDNGTHTPLTERPSCPRPQCPPTTTPTL